MVYPKAQVVDVLRSMQRDNLAITALEENIQSLLKSLGTTRHYRNFNKYIPLISSFWYYYVTSANNSQTLGEEYSNILRLTSTNMIPNKMTQLFWLILYIGGEPMLNRLISYTENQVKSSGELREEARETLLNILDLYHTFKGDLLMIHRALFYLNSKFYSFAHRMAGIKYIILRDWLEDKTFQRNFRILGTITLCYTIFNMIVKLRTSGLNKANEEESLSTMKNEYSVKICALCNEMRKEPSATSCGHIFCWECIQESLRFSNKCPLCREEIAPSRIIFLQNYS